MEASSHAAGTLITGGSGFIGTNLVEYYIGRGSEVVSLDVRRPRMTHHEAVWRRVDVLDSEELVRVVARARPSLVIHLAARTDLEGRDVAEYRANTEGVRNLIRAISAAPTVERVVFSSSRLVCRIGHIPEHDSDYTPTTAYGASKAAGEQIVRSSPLDVPWTIVRPTSIWGPHFDIPYRSFFTSIARGRYVHPSGPQIMKSYGYVGNTVYQVDRVASAPVEAVDRQTMYVADYPPLELREWATKIAHAFGVGPVRTVPRGALALMAKAGDAARRLGWRDPPLTSFRFHNLVAPMVYDLEPLRAVVGALPHSLEEGIDATVEWLRAEAGLLR